MPDSQFTHTERLAKLVEDKRACLGQLRSLGGRQQELIEDGDMTQLLTLLSTKQRFIALLQSLERDLAPFRSEDPDARVWSSPQARARCAEEAAQCGKLLDEVVDQERKNESLMHQRRHAVADRLHQVHAQARASGAYRLHLRERPAAAAGRSVVQGDPQVEGYAGGRPPAPPTTLDLSSDIR